MKRLVLALLPLGGMKAHSSSYFTKTRAKSPEIKQERCANILQRKFSLGCYNVSISMITLPF